MKHQGYLNRALKSSDRRYARIFGKLGYDTTALQTDAGADLCPIPDDWRDLPWPALKSLAASVSDDTIKTKDDAIAAVELELQRRTGGGNHNGA
jgi:hypothetical protein